MSVVTKKFVICDKCGACRQVEDVCAFKLPSGWWEARDFYGNTTHCCDGRECIWWLNNFSAENGLEVRQ